MVGGKTHWAKAMSLPDPEKCLQLGRSYPEATCRIMDS